MKQYVYLKNECKQHREAKNRLSWRARGKNRAMETEEFFFPLIQMIFPFL